jgi:hypothetical protein
MTRRTSDSRRQLVLSLERESGHPPLRHGSEALLQALADLLLAACGKTREEQESPQGGANEREDHI